MGGRTRPAGRRRGEARRAALACALFAGWTAAAGAQAPGGGGAPEPEAAEPPRAFAEQGRLLATAGVGTVEGAAGGGIVPWAAIAGHGTRDAWGVAANVTTLRLADVSLHAAGAALGAFDRLELSYQHQWFDTRAAGGRLGIGRGYTFEQDVIGAKLRLWGDLVADQDRWMPQVAVGVQHKVSADGALVRVLGARNRSGTDFYVAATKLVLEHSLLLNATVRLTRANQWGLLGHGGDRHDDHRAQFEGSAALLLRRDVAVGAEVRTKPDNLRFAREGAAWDAFLAWFPRKGLSVTLAYADLGPIAGLGRQDGVYLSLQAGF